MERSGASFCFANAYRVDALSGECYGAMLPMSSEEQEILSQAHKGLTVNDIIKMKFLPTASFFQIREAYLSKPALPKGVFSGDRATQLFSTYYGSACYLDDIVSIYRVNVPNSAMARWDASDDAKIKVSRGFAGLYEFFDVFTEYKYHDSLRPQIEERLFGIMLLEGDKSILPKKIALKVAERLGNKEMLKYCLFAISPQFYRVIRRFAGKA